MSDLVPTNGSTNAPRLLMAQTHGALPGTWMRQQTLAR